MRFQLEAHNEYVSLYMLSNTIRGLVVVFVCGEHLDQATGEKPLVNAFVTASTRYSGFDCSYNREKSGIISR
jgi:hypothetical protein